MSTDDPYIGVRLTDSGYKLVAKIGEGGMGAVYRAAQEGSSTEVAVKILHIKYALEEEFVKRFKQEVKVMRSLRHPNTVRIIEDGEMDDGSLYIVMELLEGRGLDQALKQDGPWPLERAIPMMLRVAYAMEEAHRLGIVHRDMKPENIFLVRRPAGVEIPKLLDFGLAKVSRAGDSGGMSLTQEGDILGTPAFMSPEQSFGEQLDGRADIYSLAVILYELLTGALPFEETSGSNQIARYLNEPIPIDQRVEGLLFPQDLWPVLARALQKLPEDRYSTAMEFADALKPFNSVTLSLAPPAIRAAGAPGGVTLQSAPNLQGLPLPPPRTPLPPPRTPVPPPKGPASRPPSLQHHTPVPPPLASTSRHRIPSPGARPSDETSHRIRPEALAAPRSRALIVIIIAVLLLAAIAAVVVLKS
jgi:serine/threonine protein kinase